MKSGKGKGLFVVFLVLLGILMMGLLFQGIFLTTMSNTVQQAQAEGVDTMLARQGWFQAAGWITLRFSKWIGSALHNSLFLS